MSLPEQDFAGNIPETTMIWFKLTPIVKAIELMCASSRSRSLYMNAMTTRLQIQQFEREYLDV